MIAQILVAILLIFAWLQRSHSDRKTQIQVIVALVLLWLRRIKKQMKNELSAENIDLDSSFVENEDGAPMISAEASSSIVSREPTISAGGRKLSKDPFNLIEDLHSLDEMSNFEKRNSLGSLAHPRLSNVSTIQEGRRHSETPVARVPASKKQFLPRYGSLQADFIPEHDE
ncbi:unnamed protein product [Oikopleura dioica]|uniref:Uncharacterized protein n=1 Tax=Oikopleura dioica TaxID=34765 RepID=E4YP45_OIKDI|nr:unnamed protein product [Oikopleura dioica]